MKSTKFYGMLLLEAAACILFCLLQLRFFGMASGSAAAPFEQIGFGLRKLSLSSPLGNAAAVILYVLLSLVPCMVYCALRVQGKDNRTDLLLAGLSILLFFVLYYSVNPGMLGLALPEGAKWMPGAVFYSALSGYLVLRALQAYVSADVRRLQQGLIRLLGLLDVIFVYVVFGKCFGELLSSMQALQTMGQGMDSGIGLPLPDSGSVRLSYLFLMIQFVIRALPYVLDMIVIFLAVRLIGELSADRYSDQAVLAAAELAGCCVKALSLTVASGVGFNILQFAFGRRLYQVNITVTVPVASVLFVLAMLLSARYIQEEQKLKQDNDLFI